MARPNKEGLDYFPFDVDIDQNDKIQMIEALHGIAGFAIIVKLMMKIYKEGYYYDWNKREQLLFSKRVNVDINTVCDVVNDCIKEKFFNKRMFEEHAVLTSKGIQSRYLEAVKRRKEVAFRKELFLIEDTKKIVGTSNITIILVDADNNGINVDINAIDVNISTQRKGNRNRNREEIEIERKEGAAQEIREGQNQTAAAAENVFSFYQNNFGMINPYMSGQISQWIDDIDETTVMYAMEIGLMKNARNWAFVNGILKDWFGKGVKSRQDAEALQAEFAAKQSRTSSRGPQSRKPKIDIVDEKTETGGVTPEELAELLKLANKLDGKEG